MERRIAALFVQKNGCYFGLPDVDPWDEARDARTYAGPWPVVAHPPCARWCLLAGMVEYFNPHLKIGEDGGCFAAALNAVRAWGGVLEHPAYSKAWPAFDLPTPPIAAGKWARAVSTFERMSKKQRSATPLPFRDLLIAIARSAHARPR